MLLSQRPSQQLSSTSAGVGEQTWHLWKRCPISKWARPLAMAHGLASRALAAFLPYLCVLGTLVQWTTCRSVGVLGEARRLGTSPRGSSLWVHTGGSRVTRENNLTSVVRHFTFITSKSRNETQVYLKFSPTPCGYTVQIFHAKQIFKAKRQNYSLRFLGLKMSCRFI